jgi:hypothetical protein
MMMKNNQGKIPMQDDEKPRLRLEFAPGCFDSFEGTQEELDELIEEITRMVESGEILEQAVSLEDDDFPPDVLEELQDRLDDLSLPRRLN